MANKAKDLASGTLSSSISASTTSISVSCGSGSDLALLTVWPTTPFYITVMPANPSASVPNSLDSEVMKVSALNANDGIVNMAVSRGQRGTTAKAFSAGDIVSHAVYAEDAVLLGEEVSPENPSPWVGTDEIEDEAITTDKIANNAITSGKIDWTSNGGVIKTISDQSGTRTGVYFADGTMICYRVVSGNTPITTAVGSLYYADVPSTTYWALAPASATGAADFISSPTVSVSVLAGSTQYMWAGTGAAGPINTSETGNRWSLPTNAVRLFRATSHNYAFYVVHIIAIGRWK